MPDPTLPIIEAVTKESGLIKEIYGDLAKPGVAQVGKALSTVLGLGNTILWPLMLANERAGIALRANLERYRARLEAIPMESVVVVPPEIGNPVTEKLTYVSDDSLSKLYVDLLASASTFAKSKLAHPSFIHVIENLSPDEASILRHITAEVGELEFGVDNANKHYNYRVPTMRFVTDMHKKAPLAFPTNMRAYFDNLRRLGLISLRSMVGTEREAVVAMIRELYYEIIGEVEEEAASFWDVAALEGEMLITPFGRMFLSACSIEAMSQSEQAE